MEESQPSATSTMGNENEAPEQEPVAVVGLHVPDFVYDAAEVLQRARQDGFDFVTTYLSGTTEARSDITTMDSRWWLTSIVGIAHSEGEGAGNLANQMEWAEHMNLPVVTLPPVPGPNMLEDYARTMQTQLRKIRSTSMAIWVPVSLTSESLNLWNRFHRLCHHHPKLGVLLTLDPIDPQFASQKGSLAKLLDLMHRFIGSGPVAALSIPTEVFLTNKRGFPVLSKLHQVIVSELFRRIGQNLRVLIRGPSHHTNLMPVQIGNTGCLPYLQYIHHLRSRDDVISVLDTEEAKLEADYLDALQEPLQPLSDHLGFENYVVFEKDPVKYREYQVAIRMALSDRRESTRCTIAVVGAGRGPLVNCALQAYNSLAPQERPVELSLWAVEKNPSAVMYLQSLATFDATWKQFNVRVIHSDLRELTMEVFGGLTVDIVVSELLGSFGDNELSPECLDGFYSSSACRPDTLSIPSRYIAHLSTISSIKIHNAIRERANFPDAKGSGVIGMQKAMETPYVVRTCAASQMHDEQSCWTFVHPASNVDKCRFQTLDFGPSKLTAVASKSGYGLYNVEMEKLILGDLPVGDPTMQIYSTDPWLLTGFIGTFNADLYYSNKNAFQTTNQISTAPKRFSEKMFSWFPLYFPLSDVIHVPARASVKVNIWRRVDPDARKVWYEWSATVLRDGEVLACTPIHNPGGRSSYMST